MKRYLIAALCAALAIVAVALDPFTAACLAVIGLLGWLYIERPLMFSGVTAALFVGLFAVAAVAADATPEAVAQATGEGTKVAWAYGATIQQWASAAGTLIFAVVMWALRQLPAQIYAILVTARADQLIQKAIEFGVNAVKDATKDKTLEVNVGNEVLAKALQYVLDNAPGWLTAWLGGPEAIAKKIWARLKLDPAASDTDVAAIADRVASAQ